MKRSILLFTVLTTSILVSAQVVKGTSEHLHPLSSVENTKVLDQYVGSRMATMPKEIVFNSSNKKDASVGLRKSKTRADESFIVMYPRPRGVYFQGIEDGAGWYNATYLEGAPFVDWTFIPLTNSSTPLTYSWDINGKAIEQDENSIAKVQIFGNDYTPTLTGEKGGEKATYTRGQYSQTGGGVIEGGFGYFPMSMSDPAEGGVYGGFNNSDFHFGTGQKNSKGTSLTGLVSVFDTPISPLYAKSVNAYVVPVNEQNAIIPTGIELSLNLYKVVDNIITDEIVGTASATIENVSKLTPTSNISVINFEFTEDEDGFKVIKPIPIDCSVAVTIENIDKANFNVLFANNDGFGGSGYILYGNDFEWLGFNDDPETPAYDYHIVINAAFPTLYINPTNKKVNIPAEGGLGVAQVIEGKEYNDIDIYTTLPLYNDDEDENANIWIENKPTWLDISYDDELFEEYGVIMFFMSTEEKHEGREAYVTFHTYSGISNTVHVVQGDGEGTNMSISNEDNISVIYQNNNFELSYPKELTSVSVLNASGQIVANYKLPANGNFTIPANNLLKGLYILKFNGSQTATVKIVK